MKRFYIIDAYSFIYRFYFAYKNTQLMNKQGIPTAAIYGFTKFLIKLIEEDRPEYLAVAFDVGKPTFRMEIYNEYKQNRLRMPDDLQIQIPYIKQIVRNLGIKTIELEGYEADDVIATLSKKFSEEAEIFILTGDKDALQLVNDRVRVYHKHKDGTIFYPATVKEKFGVLPEQVIDKLALMGDASDNIPGVKGIGEKTANMLVQQFGTLENLYQNLEKVSSPRLRNILEQGREAAFLSKKLIVLDNNLALDFKLEDFKFGNPDYRNIYDILKELEFNSIIQELNLERKKEIRVDFKILTDISDYIEGDVNFIFVQHLNRKFFIGLFNGNQVSVVCAADAYSIKKVLMSVKNTIVTYHFKKLLRLLGEERYYLDVDVFDLMIGYWLLGVSRKNFDFEQVIDEYLGIKISQTSDPQSLLLEDQYFEFVAQAAYVLAQFHEKLKTEFDELGLHRIYKDIERPLIYTLAYMEKVGIKVDLEELRHQQNVVIDIINKLQTEIYELAGETFNINSTKQLQYILYEKLGIKHGRRTKTGFSTDEKTLEKLKKEHPIIEKILAYREVTKLQNTYIKPLPQYVASDGRVHTTYNQVGTITGRLSSENPNMQNIPAREGLGREIRKVFVAEKGFKLISMDYSQIELRVLAHFSEDEALIESFMQDRDIHTSTAARIFSVEESDVTEDMRRFAKIINFSIIYGKTKYGLAADLKIPVIEAEKYIINYFALHSGVQDFLNRVVADARQKGYVKTMYGRIRFIPEIRSENFNEFSLGKRYAVNTIIQGTAADIIKIAMNRIYNTELIKDDTARLLLQIHDELVFEVKEDMIEETVTQFKEIMENVDRFKVPLKVNVGIGDNWYDTK